MNNEIKKNKTIKGFLGIIVIVIIVGFLAGITGEFFTRYYLSNITFFRDLYFTDLSNIGQRDIVIRDPRKVIVEQDLRVDQLKNEVKQLIVGIFKSKTGNTLLDQVLLPEDYLGQAVILTSDGWLIATQNIVTNINSNIIISYNKKIYTIEKLITDDLTGIVFIKINAQNLPVIKMADWENITDGQQVIVYNSYYDQLNLANILDKNYKQINNKFEVVSSSEELDKFILLNKTFTREFKGSPLINFQGKIIGFLDSQNNVLNQAIPIHYIVPIISQILKNETISRPYLGLNYLNLNLIYGLTQEQRQGAESGALIWADRTGEAIKSDSPLFNILEAGDIIISLEDQKVNDKQDLLDIILEYKTGQEISLKYLHEEKEEEVSIILK